MAHVAKDNWSDFDPEVIEWETFGSTQNWIPLPPFLSVKPYANEW